MANGKSQKKVNLQDEEVKIMDVVEIDGKSWNIVERTTGKTVATVFCKEDVEAARAFLEDEHWRREQDRKRFTIEW